MEAYSPRGLECKAFMAEGVAAGRKVRSWSNCLTLDVSQKVIGWGDGQDTLCYNP